MASGRAAGTKLSPPFAPSGTCQLTRAVILASKAGSGPGLFLSRPKPNQESDGGGIVGNDGIHEGIDSQPHNTSALMATSPREKRLRITQRLPGHRTSLARTLGTAISDRSSPMRFRM